MKVVLVMFKDGERREFPVASQKTIVGRRQDCGLRIPTQDVSRQHCELLLSSDGLTARDLGSSNGTYVNDTRVAEAKLKAGDRLAIGPVVFVVQIDGKPASISPADAARPKGMPAKPAAPAFNEDDTEELLELDDSDFELDDVMAELDAMKDDDEDDVDPKKRKK